MEYDVAIIGGGPAGYPCALRLAELNMQTVLINQKKELGGVCLHEGCIPSKTLLNASEQYSDILNKKIFGLESTAVMNLRSLMKEKEKVIKTLSDGLEILFSAKKLHVVSGRAFLEDSNSIRIADSNGIVTTIKAKRIILATGSSPIPLPFLPFDEKLVLSSTAALSLDEIPKRFAVIGAGVIGCEMASIYERLHSNVTLIEMLPTICPGIDQSLQAGLLASLKSQGLTFFLNSRVEKAVKTDKGVHLAIKNREGDSDLQVDKVLIAIGRSPNSKNMGLEELGIVLEKSGHVKVSSCYETEVPHVYAIGDLIKGPMLAHRATEEGIALAEYLAGKSPSVDMIAIPSVIYTHPEVATVGLTEEEARRSFSKIKAGKVLMKINGRALATGDSEGFVKVIGDAVTDRLLGVHILSRNASEMIAVASLALIHKATLQELSHLPFAHPTRSEAIKEAAHLAK